MIDLYHDILIQNHFLCAIIMTNNSNIITLSQAIVLTHAFQNTPKYQGNSVASMIDASAYQQLLAQPGCVKVRTYFALDQGTLTIVVVGVDDAGNDMTNGIILDLATNCPIACHQQSPLML